MSSIEERLAELHARFSDVYSAGENMSNEFYTAMDLATQLAGVLRETESWLISREHPAQCYLVKRQQAWDPNTCTCGLFALQKRVDAILDGGDDAS